MNNRTAIITGANSGIGRAAAKALAGARAHVVLAVRDTAKGEAAAASIPGSTEVRALDLASLDSIRAFASGWTSDVSLLINNAGVMAPPLSRTADGFELQFGTNHLGHFALTNLLLPDITGRVVTVSSTGHRFGAISATSTGSAAATGAGPPTASPSSPTCCSRWSYSAASRTPAPTSSPLPPTRGTPPPTCSSTPAAA